MKAPRTLDTALALAFRRWEKASGPARRLQREAIARVGLALVDQFERLSPELAAIRELFERSIPPVVRAHRQLDRILKAHHFKPRTTYLGTEWPARVDPKWVSRHVLLTGFLLGQPFLRFSPPVTQQLESIQARFKVAEDEALEGLP